MTPSPVLDVRGVTYVRDGHAILDGVDLLIDAGEHWAILGPNGCGKSTLLQIATGYEWPTRGAVSLFGERYGQCDMPALKKRLGLVSSALGARLPAKEPAAFHVATGLHAQIGRWRQYSGDEDAAARRALARIGALDIADRPWGQLSQGERQRVLIARALINEPDLLVLDEPCSGLDPAARDAFLRDVSGLVAAEGGPTLILVTHHVEEIPAVVSHAMVMRAGRVVAAGRVDEVVADGPMSEAFGVDCRVRGEAGRRSLVIGSATPPDAHT